MVACGGSAPAPETPAEQPPEEPEDAPGSPPSMPPEEEDATSDSDPPEEAASEEDEASSSRKVSPKDVISSQGVMFSFSFKKSDAYEKARTKCEGKSGDDPAKLAKCMGKAGQQFDADSIAFRKDDEGVWWWTTIRRRGKSLTALHKIEFEFGNETETSITIKPKGRDKGSKPMRVPAELVIQVPDDTGIVLDDPKHGRMFYEAKMGLIGETER
jgi:hypothetical protein